MAIDVARIEEATRQGRTIGVVPINDRPRMRREIDEFIKDAPCFNLYLLALIDLQRLPNARAEDYFGTRRPRWNAPFSYFQISGIHGKPFSPWDGVSQESLHIQTHRSEKAPEGSQAHEPSRQAGYCSHSSDLFPTWHRAYLAMYEQSIFLQMESIANTFPPPYRETYLDACDRFAIPFWDPFLPRRKVLNKYGYRITKCGVPVVMSSKEILVRTPRRPSQLLSVPNPLYSYQFASDSANWVHEAGYSFKDMFDDVNSPNMTSNTIRGPTATGFTNHQYVNNTLTNAVSTATGPALPLGSKIYRILQGPPLNYTQMANSAYIEHTGPSMNRENSLEGFHNDIHTMCGNGGDGRTGHMGLTEYAAFDPVFWLHHANVDRIFAIWQALNPDTWDFHQNLLDSPTYVRAVGALETPTSWLIPFRKEVSHHAQRTLDPFADPGSSSRETVRVDWWTSNDLRECKQLGYTYPELQLVKTQSEKIDIRPLRQWVTDNYEWSTIYGDSPPWTAVFDSEDFLRVEALPEVVKIDGIGGPVLKRPAAVPQDNRPSKSTGWFHRNKNDQKKGSDEEKDRYRHIRPLMQGSTLTHWNITVKVRKFALNGSFQIFFFLGDFGDDPHGWSHERHLVGIDGVFANRHIDYCENCQRQDALGLLDSDTIALTTNLVAYWKNEEVHCGLRLRSLEARDVLPFLKANLHWRVLDSRGRQHDPRGIESLRVDIGSQKVRMPTEFGAQPVYENEVRYSNVATGI